MSIPEIVSVAKLKAHLSEVLNGIGRGEVYEIINRSEPVAIILSVERYTSLLEKIEDLEDGLLLAEDTLEDYEKACGSHHEAMTRYWSEHPEEAPIPWEKVKSELWPEEEEGQPNVQHNR